MCIRDRYKMSGNVSIDPTYWSKVADYLATSGVRGYEQDWLGDQAHTDFNLTDPYTFLDGMSGAMAQRGVSMQYCMTGGNWQRQRKICRYWGDWKGSLPWRRIHS